MGEKIETMSSFSQVLKQLPAKEEKIEFCLMSEKQKVLYEALLKKLKTSTNGESKPHFIGFFKHFFLPALIWFLYVMHSKYLFYIFFFRAWAV